MKISDRIINVRRLMEQSYSKAKSGNLNHSNDIFIQAYLEAKDLIDNNDAGMFDDDEHKFLKKIIKEFEID
jgi:hypothetical protein